MGRTGKRQQRAQREQREQRLTASRPPQARRPEAPLEPSTPIRALGVLDGLRAAALPQAPQVSPAAAADAAQRVQRWLTAHPEQRAQARSVWAGALEDADGSARAMLLRVIDDWLVCDLGWPRTVAGRLAQAASQAGEGDVALALWAMHGSHLHGWQITGDDWDLENAHRPPQVFELTRLGQHDSAWALLPGLQGAPDLFIHLAARLWPAGDGTWCAAPGALPFPAEPEFEPPPPDAPGAGRAVVESAALTWAQAWQAGRTRVAACEALLTEVPHE